MNRTELQWLAKERIREAKVLLDAQYWSGAYYLAGYAVECALKACIAKGMQAEEFPDKSFADKCWTHNLVQLLGPAGLKDDFDAAMLKALPADELKKTWEKVVGEAGAFKKRLGSRSRCLFLPTAWRKSRRSSPA